jgi:hypothetical protein
MNRKILIIGRILLGLYILLIGIADLQGQMNPVTKLWFAALGTSILFTVILGFFPHLEHKFYRALFSPIFALFALWYWIKGELGECKEERKIRERVREDRLWEEWFSKK